jgi:hypothetical protein
MVGSNIALVCLVAVTLVVVIYNCATMKPYEMTDKEKEEAGRYPPPGLY